MKTPQPETAVLGNGLRMIVDPMPAVETASVGIWVEAGARHERPAVNGISHVLEHMAFKGTARRSAQAIAEEMDAVGGHLNAYTSHENTAYYAKVLKGDLPLALDILADILCNSVFDADELEREINVILQEIHHAQETPDDIIFDLFQETAFPSQGLGRPVLGRPEVVRELKQATLRTYLDSNYGAKRMVLAAAGNVRPEDVFELGERLLGGIPADRPAETESAQYKGGETRSERSLEQTHAILGFEGVPAGDDAHYALSVLSALFGGGMSSRLFQEIRERRGLAYSVYSFASAFDDSGLFGVYMGTEADQAGTALEVVIDEARKLSGAIPDAEMARARTQLKAGLLMSLESTSSRVEQRARQMTLFNRPLSPGEIVERIEAVDAAAVRTMAARLLASPPTLTVVGPAQSVPGIAEIAERLGR